MRIWWEVFPFYRVISARSARRHSHDFLEEPVVVNGVPIVQAGTGTDQIGRFDIRIDTEENRIDSFTWTPVPINEHTCPRDLSIEEVIRGYKDTTDEKYGRIITKLVRKLTAPSPGEYLQMSNALIGVREYSARPSVCPVSAGPSSENFRRTIWK